MTPPPSRSDAWLLTYDTWDPAHQPLREALCTLGNGYVATRGAAEEASAGGAHYPGTYLAGGYNRLCSTVADRMIENEDLVNWPNWLCLSFRTHGGPWFHVDAVTIVEFQQQLDLRRGVLARRVRFRDADGRETTLISRRIVHMGNPHLAAVAWELTPLNWSGEIEVRAALDGTVTNSGVERYRTLSSRHLRVLEACESDGDEESIVLAVETTQSRLRMTQAARTRVLLGNGTPLAADRRTIIEGGLVEQRLRFDARTGTSARIEKTVAIFSSRDLAISEPTVAARNAIARAPSFD
jgi:trehalose/maltose hydrolase-like predicted phosphorylase